jgi:hypothetical protein
MAGKAGFVLRLVDGFSIDEAAETPSAGRGIFFRVLDHDLNGRGVPDAWRDIEGVRADYPIFWCRENAWWT